MFMIIAILGEFVLPGFVVTGDASATARNIATSESLYRLDILIGGVTLVIFIYLVASLYQLLKHIDAGYALQMVLLVSIGVAFSFANLALKFVPLVVLNGTDYLSVFSKPQLDAFTLGVLRLHGSASNISSAFWGLWLFPFGILVYRSGFVPRIFGVLLIVAGVGYLAASCTTIVLPAYRQVVSRIATPLYLGEVPIIFWLMIRGVSTPEARQDPGPARS